VWPIVFGAIYAVLCRVEKLLPVRKYFLLASGIVVSIISIPLFILALQVLSVRPEPGYTPVRQHFVAWYMLGLPIILLGVLPIYFGVKGILQERKERQKQN